MVNNTIQIEFPRENKNCHSCGICKGEIISEFKEDNNNDVKIIFVGDGYSDACGAREADILFAKKDLVEYCCKNKISYYPYDSFEDVTDKLFELGIVKV